MAKFSLNSEGDISASCDLCGKDLDLKSVEVDKYNDVSIVVGACEKCAEDNYNQGWEEGIAHGEKQAKEELEPQIQELNDELADCKKFIDKFVKEH